MDNSGGPCGSQQKSRKSRARVSLGAALTVLMAAIISYCMYAHHLAREAGNYEVDLFSGRTIGFLCTLLLATLACFSTTVEDLILDGFKFVGKLALKFYRLSVKYQAANGQKVTHTHDEPLPVCLDEKRAASPAEDGGSGEA